MQQPEEKGPPAIADRACAAAVIAENAREMERLAESAGLDVLARVLGLVRILVKAELEKSPRDPATNTEKR